MKKMFLTLVSVMFTFLVNAQGIYTKVTKYDKFDDIEWTKEIKTLITKTDTTFVIETKGKKPETYRYVDNPLFALHEGRRDSLSNLVGNVWGYESQYIVLTNKNIEDILPAVKEQLKDIPDSLLSETYIQTFAILELLKKCDKLPTITVRTISRYRFSYEYDTDIIWIKFEDGSRIIYSKR